MKLFILFSFLLPIYAAHSYDQNILLSVINQVENRYHMQEYQTLRVDYSFVDDFEFFKQTQDFDLDAFLSHENIEKIDQCIADSWCNPYFITHHMEQFGALKTNYYLVMIEQGQSYQKLKIEL